MYPLRTLHSKVAALFHFSDCINYDHYRIATLYLLTTVNLCIIWLFVCFRRMVFSVGLDIVFSSDNRLNSCNTMVSVRSA